MPGGILGDPGNFASWIPSPILDIYRSVYEEPYQIGEFQRPSQSPMGLQLREALTKQIESQRVESAKRGKTTALETMSTRGLMSTGETPYAATHAETQASTAAQQLLAQLEARMMQGDLDAAQAWQRLKIQMQMAGAQAQQGLIGSGIQSLGSMLSSGGGMLGTLGLMGATGQLTPPVPG